MTKNNPERLCKSCAKFDYDMNRRDGISFDMFVRCECNSPEVTLEELKKLYNEEKEEEELTRA